jgi:hypothetical protein
MYGACDVSCRGIAHLSIMAGELGGVGGHPHDIVLRALRVDCSLVLWLTGQAMATGVPVGLPWYRRSDYAALLALFTDPDKLPTTYDEWLSHAEIVEKRLRTAGLAVVRVWIRPRPFDVWCKQQGLLPDQRARLSFANEVARQHGGQPE